MFVATALPTGTASATDQLEWCCEGASVEGRWWSKKTMSSTFMQQRFWKLCTNTWNSCWHWLSTKI